MNDDTMRRPMVGTPVTRAPEQPGSNEVISQAGDLARRGLEEAQRLTSTTRDRLMREADSKKDTLAQKLDGLAGKIEGLAGDGEEDDLQRQVIDGATRAVRSVSRTLSGRSTEELIDAAGRAIRERPGLFLAGCAAIGFLGARLLRR